MSSQYTPDFILPSPTAIAKKRILVMGLGVHGGGLGVVRWLIRHGASVTVTDMAHAEQLEGSLAALHDIEHSSGASVTYVLGEHRDEDFTSHDIVIANPAVPPHSPWLAVAQAAGVPIETEMTLFFRFCTAPIIGVTGTKGKTTTTLLTAAMLRQTYAQTVVAGNLRVSALDLLDTLTPATPVVLELSSFQLERLAGPAISPPYSCITNFSPDHLNYHGSLENYARAKQQIFAHQQPDDIVVLNAALDRIRFAVPHSNVITFSSTPPHANGTDPVDCCVNEHGHVLCCQEHLFDVQDVHLSGKHNLDNVLAATALAHSFGISADRIRAAVQTFHGVEHRMELVRTFNTIQYINDTTATNPAATIAALQALGKPVILIAGGADKNLNFTEMGEVIAQRTGVLVLLAGSATSQIEQAVRAAAHPTPPILGPYTTLVGAVQAAREAAPNGATIIMSPGCASFGMFRNEFHRGEEFRRIVMSLL